jgi:CDP-paratose 2-epimerase
MSHADRSRSIVIFGGAGFIGSNWAARLLRQSDARVHVFDNVSRAGVRHNLDWLEKQAAGSDRLHITLGDIRDAAMVARAVRTATEIYHFAAQTAVTTSLTDPRHDFEVNVGGTFNILEAARASGRKPFLLFTSTNKVYGRLRGVPITHNGNRYTMEGGVDEQQPLDFHSPYGCSKGAADQYVHDYARVYGLPTVIFRMSCIAGPRQFGTEDQGWVAHFLYSALERAPLTIYGDGRQVRDVLHVDDLMDAMDAARVNLANTSGEAYNIGGGAQNTISLMELIAELEQLTGSKLDYTQAPARAGDQLIYVTDFRKLTAHTGWKPQHSVSAILHDLHAFWRANQHLFTSARVLEFTNMLGKLPQAVA